MPFSGLSTAKVARAAGVHPNTVRLYEQAGLIAPVPRSPKGYRLFTPAHVDQMVLARTGLEGAYPGPIIRRSMIGLIKTTAAEDYPAALDLARAHLRIVQAERAQAEAAADVLQHWASESAAESTAPPLWIGEAASRLHLTVDVLRNWERSGLVTVSRSPANGYRLYRPVELGRLMVIRMLRQAGYSPMAILRMLVQMDQDGAIDLRAALDTPRPDEDVYSAADRWLSTLAEHEQRARQIILRLEDMVRKYSPRTLPAA